MKNKPKQIIKPNSQSNTTLIEEIRKKKSIKKRENELIGLTCQTYDLGHKMKTT